MGGRDLLAAKGAEGEEAVGWPPPQTGSCAPSAILRPAFSSTEAERAAWECGGAAPRLFPPQLTPSSLEH